MTRGDAAHASHARGRPQARPRPAPDGPEPDPAAAPRRAHQPGFQRALAEHGLHAIWVEDPESEGIEPVELLPEPVRAETAACVASALDTAREAIGASQQLPPSVLGDLRDVVALIAATIADSPDAALVLATWRRRPVHPPPLRQRHRARPPARPRLLAD